MSLTGRGAATRSTTVIHPQRGQNWRPGREPASIRDRADENLAAEIRATNERHPWIGAAMSEHDTSGIAHAAGAER